MTLEHIHAAHLGNIRKAVETGGLALPDHLVHLAKQRDDLKELAAGMSSRRETFAATVMQRITDGGSVADALAASEADLMHLYMLEAVLKGNEHRTLDARIRKALSAAYVANRAAFWAEAYPRVEAAVATIYEHAKVLPTKLDSDAVIQADVARQYTDFKDAVATINLYAPLAAPMSGEVTLPKGHRAAPAWLALYQLPTDVVILDREVPRDDPRRKSVMAVRDLGALTNESALSITRGQVHGVSLAPVFDRAVIQKRADIYATSWTRRGVARGSNFVPAQTSSDDGRGNIDRKSFHEEFAEAGHAYVAREEERRSAMIHRIPHNRAR